MADWTRDGTVLPEGAMLRLVEPKGSVHDAVVGYGQIVPWEYKTVSSVSPEAADRTGPFPARRAGGSRRFPWNWLAGTRRPRRGRNLAPEGVVQSRRPASTSAQSVR